MTNFLGSDDFFAAFDSTPNVGAQKNAQPAPNQQMVNDNAFSSSSPDGNNNNNNPFPQQQRTTKSGKPRTNSLMLSTSSELSESGSPRKNRTGSNHLTSTQMMESSKFSSDNSDVEAILAGVASGKEGRKIAESGRGVVEGKLLAR